VKIQRGYKVELDLNNAERSACVRHAGTARFAYNWGLGRKLATHEAGEKVPSAIDLHRELNVLKQSEFGWMYQCSKCAPQEALRDLDRAFGHFFRRVKLKKAGKLKGKVGFPRFKSRKRGVGSFRLTGTIRVFEDRIQLPRLGRLKLKERGYLPTEGVKILSATVSERAGHWFVSVQVEEEHADPLPARGEPVGVDLGVKLMATCATARALDGDYHPNPKALEQAQYQLRRRQRQLARRKRGSKNREKTRRKIANLHYRIANIRRNALHQATSSIVAITKPATERPRVVVVEDLNVSGMLQNRRLARAVADVGMYEFRRQLGYKSSWAGSELLLADRWYPSSKLCSMCSAIRDDLTLSDRIYHCAACGVTMDRDLNAARNLAQLATTASSAGSDACGEGIRPGPTRQSSVKQEPNTESGLIRFG
jgi:putative transposase